MLKATDEPGINWIPFARKPNIATLAFVIARGALLPYLLLTLLVPFYYRADGNYTFSMWQILAFSVIYVTSEEQSRWLFVSRTNSKVRLSLIYALGLIICESVAFYLLSPGQPVGQYAIARVPSAALHLSGAIVCATSFTLSRLYFYLTFVAFVMFHILFNQVLVQIWLDWF